MKKLFTVAMRYQNKNYYVAIQILIIKNIIKSWKMKEKHVREST